MDTSREAQKGTGGAIQDKSSTQHNEAILDHREPYGPSGFIGLFSNGYVVAYAAFSTLGGLFGYDQGVVSVIFGYAAVSQQIYPSIRERARSWLLERAPRCNDRTGRVDWGTESRVDC